MTKKHTVKRLRPVQPLRTLLPQCESPVKWMQHHLRPGAYRDRQKEKYEKLGWDVDKCKRFATFCIDGRNLCNIHSAPVALKILEEKSS